MNDKVSIIMACYNCGATLAKAVDSILAQTHTNWVMICCDDGSSDNTYELLSEYKAKYPDKFVVLQNDKNRKLPYSLNHCLEHVETELVARMDADDWSLPQRLEKQIRYLRENPDMDLVGTGVTVSDGEKKIASIIKKEVPTKHDMLEANCFSHATIMTYKSVYDKLGGYSLDPTVIRCEDVDLWCRFLAAGFVGYNLQEELYVILEDDNAVKRRTLKSRWNGAKTRSRGYKLMGFKGFKCYKPYLSVFRSFVPMWLYKKLHLRKLKRNRLG